jgi:hypothetical protein
MSSMTSASNVARCGTVPPLLLHTCPPLAAFNAAMILAMYFVPAWLVDADGRLSMGSPAPHRGYRRVGRAATQLRIHLQSQDGQIA